MQTSSTQTSKCVCVYSLYLSVTVLMSHCFHRLSLEKTLWEVDIVCPSPRKEDHCNYAHLLRTVPIWGCGKGQAVWSWGLWGNLDLMLWEESCWVQQCLATEKGSCFQSLSEIKLFLAIPRAPPSHGSAELLWLAALGHGKMCVRVPFTGSDQTWFNLCLHFLFPNIYRITSATATVQTFFLKVMVNV